MLPGVEWGMKEGKDASSEEGGMEKEGCNENREKECDGLMRGRKERRREGGKVVMKVMERL